MTYDMSIAAQRGRVGNATVDTYRDGTAKPGKPSGKRRISDRVDRLTRTERKAQANGGNIASVGNVAVPVPGQVGCTGGAVKGDCQPTAHAWRKREVQAKPIVVRKASAIGREERTQALAGAAENLTAKQRKDREMRNQRKTLDKKSYETSKKLLTGVAG